MISCPHTATLISPSLLSTPSEKSLKDWRAGNVPRNQYAAFGRRIRSEAGRGQNAGPRVCELTVAGRSRDEIAGILRALENTAITRYWQKLVKQGRLEKTASGRVAKTQAGEGAAGLRA